LSCAKARQHYAAAAALTEEADPVRGDIAEARTKAKTQ
jgi:hypothetical protein